MNTTSPPSGVGSVVLSANAEKKVGAGKLGLDLESPAKLCHRLITAILELVDQVEVHVNLSEIREHGKHSPVLTLCCSVILTILGLLGGGKVGVNRRIRGALGSGFSSAQLGRTRRQYDDYREQSPQTGGDSSRFTRQAVHASALSLTETIFHGASSPLS